MNTATVVQCTECRQTIDSKADVSFVRFKVPGTVNYR